MIFCYYISSNFLLVISLFFISTYSICFFPFFNNTLCYLFLYIYFSLFVLQQSSFFMASIHLSSYHSSFVCFFFSSVISLITSVMPSFFYLMTYPLLYRFAYNFFSIFLSETWIIQFFLIQFFFHIYRLFIFVIFC